MADEITKNMTIDDKLDFLINAVSDMNRRMSAIEERQTATEERLASIETLVQNRLQDTRPIWEAVLQHVDRLEQQQQAMQQQLDAMQTQLQTQQEQLNRLEQGQRRIDQKLDFIHRDFVELRADVGLLTKRVDALENLRQAA
jgi:chromosome segregation ATPase